MDIYFKLYLEQVKRTADLAEFYGYYVGRLHDIATYPGLTDEERRQRAEEAFAASKEAFNGLYRTYPLAVDAAA